MAAMQRKVSFYHLSQERTGDDKKKYAVSNADIEANFKHIYDHMSVLKDGNHAEKILSGNVKVVVEIIDYNPNEHSVFLKIGHQNHSNTSSLRDQNTLEATEVPMAPSQKLELFTYCYIDFSTCIVSHISLNAAPRVSALRAMFDHFLLEEFRTSSTLSVIMSSDIIDMIKKKRVSKLTVAVAVPSDSILSDRIGVGRNTFNKLQHIKKVGYTYTLSAKRFKSMLTSPNALGEMVAAIKEEHGNDLQSLRVNAKGEGEDSQVYDLLQHSLTKKVNFDVDDISLLTVDDFRDKLTTCYRANKQDLIQYIPTNQYIF